MKKRILVLVLLFLFIVISAYSQEKSKKQLKEEEKIEKQKQSEAMINAREFVFVGRTAVPTGYKTVNLASHSNYVKFHPEMIESNMPFYGKAYSGVGYGGDNGLTFEGKPDEYTVTKGKKNYQIEAVVKGEKDTYKLSLSVGFEGSASLSIHSNNRSSISYMGEISAPVKEEEKK
jgi:hypothetical protein